MNTQKFILFLFFAYIFTGNINAKVGFESETMTFINKGYHGSVWYGYNGKRARLVYAKATFPDTFTPKGFKNYTSTFKEIEIDFFFGEKKDNFRGFWFAIGGGQTDISIESKTTGEMAKIVATTMHTGVGYAISITNSFYINPWIGASVHLNAPKEVSVGAETWNPQKVDLVGGMKLGIDF